MEQNEKRYDCRTCANKWSPLCELCSRVVSPSGRERPPKYYVDARAVTAVGRRNAAEKTDDETEALVLELVRSIFARGPLPLAIVMRYNAAVSNKDGQV